jgi:hypothetical protein
MWSTTVDAPTSPILNRDGLIAKVTDEEPVTWEQACSLVDAAALNGTSDPNVDLQDLIANNRAGPNEEPLSIEEILANYSR